MPHENEPIAIIGSACRFPGDATSPSKLWSLLQQPHDVSRTIDRFPSASFYNKDGHHHGASNVQRSYLLTQDPRLFDAQFFSIPPGEAESIDPQQRVLLETVYDAVETSGLVLERLRGTPTAVYVGVMCDDYGNICYADPESIPTYAATGTARSILANRVSFVFDWRGPSMTIDTACSSSLVALHQGVQALRAGTAPVAVAAGANLIFSPNMFVAESNLNMLSPTGHSKMWDAAADGYARGEGVAAVVLKRLTDALRDGDHIECVIRETGVNQDGHTPGITMPSAEAQTRLIRETYARAGLDLANPSDRPQYFEAHGTGTKAGDGVESKAIYNAFFPDAESGGSANDEKDHDSTLWVGSVKTIIGHTEGTAGIAGVMKASLAIQNRTIPPNMHFHTLNPAIEPYYGKLQIATTARTWPELLDGSVARASVNSFGFGGTNAHAIIEAHMPEATMVKDAPLPDIGNPLPLTFSATSEKSLTALMASYHEYLSARTEVDVGKLAWTLHDRRSTFPYRSFIAAQTRDELVAKLEKAVEEQQSGNSAGVIRGSSSDSSDNSSGGSKSHHHLLGVFTGQGAQWATMGRDLIAASGFAEDIIDKLEQSLGELPEQHRPSWSLKAQMMVDAASSRISEGELSQPLCTAVQIMLVDMLRAAGIEFDAVVGHSSGEIGAAYAAGFITAWDAIRIAFYRGRYAHLARGPEDQRGGMLAAGTTLEDARELCDLPAFKDRVGVAAYNSSSSVTLSGDLDAIEEVREVLEDEKMFNRQLKVDTAYHSHHMIPCSEKYYKALEACHVTIKTPSGRTKWYSSVYDGKLMQPCDALKHQYWVDNMVNIVLYATALESALVSSEPRLTQAIEVGPHAALKGPSSTVIEETIKSALPYTGTLCRGQNDVEAMALCLARLWAQSGRSSADWKAYRALFDESAPTNLHDLPSYPFNHERLFWYEARKSRANRLREDPAHPLLGTRTDTAGERELRWRNYIHASEVPWLQGHRIQGQTLFPAAGFLAMAVEAARVAGRAEIIQAIELRDSAIHRALAIGDDRGIETLFSLSNITVTDADDGSGASVLTARFACDACLQKQSDNFVSIASGEVVMTYGTPSSTALSEWPEEGKDTEAQGLGMLDVDPDLFYAYLANIGYNYADMFKGITSLRRATDLARGVITTNLPSSLAGDPVDQFLLHPSTLDVAFQAIFAAISFPGDGALWALHIPTTIRRVVINPAVCPVNGGVGEPVRFSATSSRSESGTFSGCVDIFPVHSSHSLCQVEGLEVSPVSPPTAKDDRPFFGQTNRWLARPDADSLVTAPRIPSGQEGDKSRLDRLSLSCLGDILRSRGHEKHQLRDWAQTVLTRLGVRTSLDATDDDGLDIEVGSSYKTNLDIIMAIVDQVNKGQLPQGSDASALLDSFYEASLGASEARDALSVLAQQIVRRYPRMNILQLSGGSGSAARAVMGRIGELFSAYTCASETDEHLAELSHEFPAISTKVIDFSLDLTEQGFFTGSYDMIIAGNGFHGLGESADSILEKLRTLMRPGGYLVARQVTDSESAHVGLTVAGLTYWPEEAIGCSSVADLGEYDALLRAAGFSGIDTATPDSVGSFSVFVSQAVDQQILHIREPLQSNIKAVHLESVLIIGGRRFPISRIAAAVKKTLAPFAGKIQMVRSVSDVDASMLASRPYVISLTELDDHFFEGLTDDRWEALKTLFFRSRHVLWATRGANGEAPFANVMKGVVRCLLVEIPHLHAQMFNIEGRLRPEQDATVMAESLMRLHIADSWKDKVPAYDALYAVERELMLRDGKLWITRYDAEDDLNGGYNALRRRVVKNVSTGSQVVALTPEKQLRQYRLTPKATVETKGIANSSVTVRQSLSTAIKLERLGFMHLSIGREMETGSSVLVLSEKNQSSLTLPKTRLVPVHVAESEERSLLVAVACQLLANDILSKVTAGSRVVLHEPPSVLAKLLTKRAAKTGAQLILTTTRRKAALQAQWKHIHAYSTDRDLRQVVTANTIVFADFSRSDDTDGGVDKKRRREIVDRLVQGLPFGAQKYTLDDLVPSRSLLYPDSTEEQVSSALSRAYSAAVDGCDGFSPFDAAASTRVQQIAVDASLAEMLTTVDWTDTTPFPASVTPAMDEVSFRPDRTYFFVGMTGSLGLSTCEYMMERGARFFALSSRRPSIDAHWLDRVGKMYGATVKAFALDITSRASLRQVHDDICESMPPIAGVANGALIMRDGLFMDSSAATMNEALGPKVAGSVYLDELFYDTNLDFFMLYSSLVYITGNIGQTSYAAGNGFMVSLVHGRRARGLNASVMNLGGISGIGYITRTDHNILGRLDVLGYGIMSELDYRYFFAESVMAGAADSGRDPEVSAGLRFVNKTEKNPPKWVVDPKFSHYIIDRSSHDGGDRAGGGGDGALSAQAQLLEATTAKEAFNIILGALVAMIGRKLDLPPTESVHSDVAIVEMGVDSLVAVDMRSWFSNEFKHDIPIIKILGGATLADLVEDTVANLSPDMCPNISSGDSCSDAEAKSEAEAGVEAGVPFSASSIETLSRDSESTNDEKESATTLSSEKASKELVLAAVSSKSNFVREEKMTHGCSRFWFLRQYLEDATCFNVLVQTRLHGRIDTARLQEAVRKVGARHEALRTSFFVNDQGEPRMGVMADSLLRLELDQIADKGEAERIYSEMRGYNFDIERGEVIRMRLLSLSETDHIFIFAVHHIAMDGFSFNLVIRDLDMMYQGKPTGPISWQFTDFAVRQRRDMESGRMRDDIAFWKKTFATIPDPLPLFPLAGVSCSRMPLVKYEHNEVEVSLAAETARRIRSLCRQQRCTTFHFFLATLHVFLARWLDAADDLCIGVADANRGDVESLSTVGFLLNLVPLRFGALNGKAPFSSVLAAAKQTAYRGLGHARLPFDVLLEELNLVRSSTASPLFQAFLDYRQLAVKTPPMLESSAEGEQNFGATAYDIVLDVTDYAAADIKIKWQTQSSLYNTKHTQTMMDSYMHLLNFFADGTSSSVESAPLYRPEHVQAAVEAGQGPQFDSQWPATLSIKIDEISNQFPEDVALIDMSNKLTYREMNRLMDQITEELVNGGVKPGDKVGIFQQPSSLWIASLLAIWRAGAVYVPLDPRNGVPRLASTVAVVEPSAIIHDQANAEHFAALTIPSHAAVINVDSVHNMNVATVRRPNLSTADSSAMIVSSSGSTGVPKCIEVRHSSLVNLFEGDSQRWKLGRANVLQQSAYSFDISMDQIMTALVHGGSLYVASEEERTNPELVAKVMTAYDINCTTATPSEYSSWISYASATLSEAKGWRIANVGGEGWNSLLRDSFATLKLPELVIQNCYGPAEASVWTTRHPIPYPGTDTLIPAGPALSNYSIYVVDKQGSVVPAGVQGEILIGGAGVAVGYYGNAELTREKFIHDQHTTEAHAAKGWNRGYKTGDKGYMTEDGALVVQGRISGDTQIKLRGFRIELEDVETSIVHASAGVLTRVVASVRGDGPASFLVAFAEFAADSVDPNQQDAYLSKLLSKLPLPQYMRPNVMIPISDIPVNSHNKVNRLVIATLPVHTTSSDAAGSELTATVKAIRDIWTEILPESMVRNTVLDASSDFFVLGGNSLLTVRLQSRLREVYGVFVPLIKIMEAPTLSGLGNTLDELLATKEIDWDAETALSKEMLQIDPVGTEIARPKTSDLTVILTGASGFIGRHLLQRLVDDERVSSIHCVAVRNIEMDSPARRKMKAIVSSTDKVHLHPGDLASPLLGLSATSFTQLAHETDLIIHSGANRSFWSAYDMVRAPNVQSTKDLALMAAIALRDLNKMVPVHFMSGSEDAATTSAPPASDGSNGYVASKWASERFLERFASHLRLPVHAHRQLPVPGGRTAEGPELDSILQEFVEVARKMPELPNPDTWRGYYDLIPADGLSDEVVGQALSRTAVTTDADSSGEETFFGCAHYSSVRMDIGAVVERLASVEEYKDADRPLIPAHVWVGKAKIAGFRYQFSTMKMSLQDGEGKNMGLLER